MPSKLCRTCGVARNFARGKELILVAGSTCQNKQHIRITCRKHVVLYGLVIRGNTCYMNRAYRRILIGGGFGFVV